MAKIKIVTDSTADLSSELIEKFDIEVVPLSIHIEGNTYLDRVDITPSEFMRKMKEADELPKSSQPPAGVLAEVYDRFGDQGYDILSIHMTGGMSGTVQSAESAAAMSHANVTVVDSRYISKALAFQVLEAAKMASEGKGIQEIVSRVETIRSNTKLFVVVDTLENLVKGGRIGKGKAMIGSLLNIKPIASLEGGVYTPVAKVRSHTQVAKYLAKQFAEDIKGKTIKGVGLVHAEGIELASKLKKMIEELDAAAEIEIEETTPIISTHTGPGAIGFMYHLEE
ncbi:DegV family protein with EDD domain [Cytobacillus firmus]|uniref:DegV family protein with EDD domain n=2 Tax=Cytobacillus TaxID=2675230 RepID=A0A366JP05_CYTFI|nr:MULTISPECIES: DegV family protein [Cytobacillus]RBP89116.1 DegV family protein with EDD domain [Cytobacillus firmus]TDX47031.1 DegV family protein with EDD domain [Cytobacillus oceanisediminis]